MNFQPLPHSTILKRYIAEEILGWKDHGKYFTDSSGVPIIHFNPVHDLFSLAMPVKYLNTLGYEFAGSHAGDYQVTVFFNMAVRTRLKNGSERLTMDKEELFTLGGPGEAEALAAAVYYANEHRLGRVDGPEVS